VYFDDNGDGDTADAGEHDVVFLSDTTGSTCHYTLADTHQAGTWVSASADLNSCFDGEFVLSHGACQQAICGDGIVDAGESCDDGNTNDGDGCSSTCQEELSQCGNSIVEGSEQCDDGNVNDGDECSNSCAWNPETCSIVTDIHFADHTSTGTTVTMGATVHDSATVACYYPDGVTVAPIPAGATADFNYFLNGSCADVPNVSAAGLDVTDGGEDSVLPAGPLSVGSVSYNAHFSGGTDIHGLPVNPADSACEPLDILSSITDFYYTVDGDSTQYNCTLEAKAAGAVPGVDCQEASAALNTLQKYTVHVVVGNDTGGSISEKAQGGLAAKAAYYDTFGNLYNPVLKVIGINTSDIVSIAGSGSCGAAVIDLSSAKTGSGNTGNVVIWGDGTTSTSQAGFAMAQGDSCELRIVVSKQFSSCGEQPVTSSWSETQTGPDAFYGKSPYTGRLSVNVCGQ
jgi:cysteine-rich repeat protein